MAADPHPHTSTGDDAIPCAACRRPIADADPLARCRACGWTERRGAD